MAIGSLLPGPRAGILALRITAYSTAAMPLTAVILRQVENQQLAALQLGVWVNTCLSNNGK